NINVNEVLANRAGELLGGTLGNYDLVDPVRHVNLGQSSNDVYPTAMRVSIVLSFKEFEISLLDTDRLLRRKSLEFERVVKVGRTHLQDTAPVTLGQEFNGWASTVERSLRRLKEARNVLLELNIGATAVGTGFNADPHYAARVIGKISH